MKVKWQSIITCLHCGFYQEEAMPVNVCIYLWECPQCKTVVKSKPGDCCVFCSGSDAIWMITTQVIKEAL